MPHALKNYSYVDWQGASGCFLLRKNSTVKPDPLPREIRANYTKLIFCIVAGNLLAVANSQRQNPATKAAQKNDLADLFFFWAATKYCRFAKFTQSLTLAACFSAYNKNHSKQKAPPFLLVRSPQNCTLFPCFVQLCRAATLC